MAELVGGARETPGSAAEGVGVAAAEEGAGSAVRVGSDSKESPISTNRFFEIPKERCQNKPQKSNKKKLIHRSRRKSKPKAKPNSNQTQLRSF